MESVCYWFNWGGGWHVATFTWPTSTKLFHSCSSVGQCGNQVGCRFWDLALREHAHVNKVSANSHNAARRYTKSNTIPPTVTLHFQLTLRLNVCKEHNNRPFPQLTVWHVTAGTAGVILTVMAGAVHFFPGLLNGMEQWFINVITYTCDFVVIAGQIVYSEKRLHQQDRQLYHRVKWVCAWDSHPPLPLPSAAPSHIHSHTSLPYQASNLKCGPVTAVYLMYCIRTIGNKRPIFAQYILISLFIICLIQNHILIIRKICVTFTVSFSPCGSWGWNWLTKINHQQFWQLIHHFSYQA